MERVNLDDLLAFVAVGRERSFTKAAARLGMSQSALSHIIRDLEARLGVRLLTRTTRSVSPTQAGERLLQTLGPRFEEIDAELAALSELRDKPAGTIRITAGDHAIHSILWPKLAAFLPKFPDIKVELSADYGLTDIVAQRYDAGVRFGEQVAKDMIAVRIGPDTRFAVVGAKSYFSKRQVPNTPQDLIGHTCINLRLATHGAIYAWEFARRGREVKVRVDGQLVFNNVFQILDAALAEFGLAFIIQAVGSPRRHSPWSSTRCVTAHDVEPDALVGGAFHNEDARLCRPMTDRLYCLIRGRVVPRSCLFHAVECDDDNTSVRCVPFQGGDCAAAANDKAASKRLEGRRHLRTIRPYALRIGHLEFGDIESRRLGR
jgi:DNA-binding transcriptional LysR family regulator